MQAATRGSAVLFCIGEVRDAWKIVTTHFHRGLITNGSHANMSPRLGGVMPFKSKIRIWKKLKAEHGNRVLVGTYAYTDADQTVEVRSLSGQRRATQLGGSTPETLARLMLIELAHEEKA